MGRRLIVVLAAVVFLTCKDPTGPAPINRLEITGPPVVYVTREAQFTAHVYTTNGREVYDRPVTWATSNPTVVSIEGAGSSIRVDVRGLAPGDAMLEATVDEVRGTIAISTRYIPILRVLVTPEIDSLRIGDSLRLAVRMIDSTYADASWRPVVWASSNTLTATVSDSGWVTARRSGGFAVTATSDDGKVGGAFLTAQEAVASLSLPDSIHLPMYQSALVLPALVGSSGTPITGRPTLWSSTDPTVATISGTGILDARMLGTASLAATSEGKSDTARVTVEPAPVSGIFLDIATWAGLPVGDTLPLGARPFYQPSGGGPLTALGNAVRWSTSDTTLATIEVDSQDTWRARARGIRPGPVQVIATSAGTSNAASLTVSAPPVSLVVLPDSVFVPVGQRRWLSARFYDAYGTSLDYALPLYSAVDTAIAVIEGSEVRGVRSGRVAVAAHDARFGLDDTVLVVVSDSGIDRLQWYDNERRTGNYGSTAASLQLSTAAGLPLAAGRTIVLTSSDTSIVAPETQQIENVTSGALVTLRAGRPGQASLVARSDSLFSVLRVTVDSVPMAWIRIEVAYPVGTVGDTHRFRAATADAHGDGRSYPLEWATVDPEVATVDETGLVRAVGPGQTQVIASSNGQSDSVWFTVQSGDAPAITAVSPSLLVPGAIARVRGSGFTPGPTANTATLDGVSGVVTGATDTVVSVQLPPAEAFACEPTHWSVLTLVSGGRVAGINRPFGPAPQYPLAQGRAAVLDETALACGELANPGARHWLAVANSTPSADAATSFEITGEAASAFVTAAPQAEAVRPLLASVPASALPAFLDSARAWRAPARHTKLLEGNRHVALRLGPPAPLLTEWRARNPRPFLSVADSVGNLVRFRVPSIEYPDFCTRYRSVTARLVYRGERALIYEDVATVLARTMDADYRTVGEEFDRVMYPRLVENFGDPLTLDGLLDQNGRIVMLFTPEVNRLGLGGFVVSCDFYPESVAPSSNMGEVFYARAADNFGSGYAPTTRNFWNWIIRSIVMHEAKHLAGFAVRLGVGAPLEDVWLEEGSAGLAEELWARSVYGNTWRSNATYGSTLYCEVRPHLPDCTGRPYAMFGHYAHLQDYARKAHARSPLGPASFDDATFYGSAWSLLRWVVDEHAVAEASFLRALTQEPLLTGVANLEARAGRPFADLLTTWSMALLTDDIGSFGPPLPGAMIRSWNTREIWGRMAADFPGTFSPFPFTPVWIEETVGFTKTHPPVRGGSFALFELITPGKLLVRVRGPNDSAPPAGLRLVLLRLP